MADDTEFRYKMTEWRGYIVKAVEDLNKEASETRNDLLSLKKEREAATEKMENKIFERLDKIDDKIEKLNGRVTGIELKVVAIGTTVSIIVSLLLHIGIPSI